MKNLVTFLVAICCFGGTSLHAETKPLKALLIAGGCCHDYVGQHKVISDGIQARANVQVDVYWTDDKSVNPPLSLYDKDDWAAGYDIIIHDECAAGNKDLKVLKRILDVHQTIPAVHLHCAMHSFRADSDGWFKHLGLQSNSHGPQEPIAISFVDEEHPVTKGLKGWTTIKEELYNNVNIFDAHPLAMGKQIVKRDGKETEVDSVVVWTNEKVGARSFSTTIGHNTETVADARYLDLITRGLLWSCDKLNDDYLGKPFTGKNKVTFVKANPVEAPKPAKATLGQAPKGATLVVATASSEETGKSNFAWRAVDGDKNTRWCAANASKPQSIRLEFEKPQTVTGARITWESGGTPYQHRIEGSADAKTWTLLVDQTGNQEKGDSVSSFEVKDIRFLQVTCTGTTNGGNWASIREIALKGPGLTTLFPKLNEKQKAVADQAKKAANDPYAKEGNVAPKIVKLTPDQEAEILKDVKVPEEFNVSLFSTSDAANYPVYVAASPNGDLYVSSDGNGSLGRDPHRGRVLRLRDTDGDGRADQVTEFVKDVDSPRGLVWDHDRLYLLHPPHISVHIDQDGDGVAEDSKMLIEGIAYGFADRPADHTTNGLDLGIDGWLYIAGGDFGFLNAKGTDGRTLQHRGGGVIRFRPDGSGLELFSTGTRNILGTPISPLLEIFARDNTNDGGGWDVRFHHFTGLEDHGYPRLYKNFGDEHVAPLADYGGGSGCGSTYLSEPGFPDEWNNAPLTCDWGTGALWHHSVQANGATYAEITDPQPFIKMTRPTDASVDGMSGIYQASWKGATFKWEGPGVGYIVRVSPKGYTPEPLPDFDKLSDAELIAGIESLSQVRVLEAQRALLRRPANAETTASLVALAGDSEKPLAARIAALYAVSQRGTASASSAGVIKAITPLADDAKLQRYVLRALGDMGLDRFAAGESTAPAELFASGLKSKDARTRLEAIVEATRQNLTSLAPEIATTLGDNDPVVAHTAFRALSMLGAVDACLSVLDSTDTSLDAKTGAARAIMRIHSPAAVDGLISRVASETRSDVRPLILGALCRLYHHEGEWKGDSWGTRPDTRGPYYQPEPWSETEKVAATLKQLLTKASSDEAGFLVREMSRNRIQSDDALTRILTLAKENPKVIPDAVAQLATAETIPADGIPILLQALSREDSDLLTISNAVIALAKTDSSEGALGSLAALDRLTAGIATKQEELKAVKDIADPVKAKSEGKYARNRVAEAQKQFETAMRAFLDAPKLENHHTALEHAAEAAADESSVWADAALLALSARKGGSPEAREMSQKAIDAGWPNPKRRANLIQAAARSQSHAIDDRILIAVTDTDPAVAKIAKDAVKGLKLQARAEDKTPKIGTLKVEEAVAAVLKTKGDVALGEQLFTKATCVACHTVSQDQVQRGPYLGNIAQTYQRPDLATNILDPNKTIAQGFTSAMITLKDGTMGMGFVTDESGDKVTIRDIASQEHSYLKADIAKRDTLPTSMMPPGLMNNFSVFEMASLVDYLEALSKKK
ncbi:MAG: discoidin domain-containing protein [Verrucomicrobiae bacterium]|nr:discoidin domain-containing protein [Verrucomicrobiae bacterium]